MKYFRFNYTRKLFTFAFIGIVLVGVVDKNVLGVVAGFLGVISTFREALYARLFELGQQENDNLRRIINKIQQFTGIWN